MNKERWLQATLALAVAVLFWVANRGAYKDYFSGDDLDNISWTSEVETVDFLKGVATPIFNRNNFRPVGHYFYHLMERLARLNFTAYVGVLQLAHLLNTWLLWMVLRRLDFSAWASLAGVIFFVFHPATFDAYWQPMYIFDVLCATLCLVSFWAFIDRHWVLSFISFWLAYKSKEVAVMLPAVFFVYEFLMGEKRWKPLIPFLAVSLSFGLQALFTNTHTNDDYTLHLTPETIADCIVFYGSRIVFSPWLLALLIVITFFIRDRRLVFGITGATLLLVPMLVLPNRLFSVYLYVPLTLAAVAITAVAQVRTPWIPALFALLWIPATYVQMREYRKAALTTADENRRYVEQLAAFIHSAPTTKAFLYDGIPESLHSWGVQGAVKYLTKHPDTQVLPLGDEGAKKILQRPELAVVSWDAAARKMRVTARNANTPDASYIDIDRGMPLWQLGEGWFPRENEFSWTQPVATARLHRPEGATLFEVSVNVSPMQIADVELIRIELLLNGESMGVKEFRSAGWQEVRWKIPPQPAGATQVEFRTSPVYQPKPDPRRLGAAIGAFGFVK